MGAAGSAEPPSDSQLRPDADWARVPPSCRPGGPSFPAELDAPEPAAPARTVTDAYDIGRRAALTTRAPPTLDAAIDDGVIVKNPCRASSVRAPKRDTRKFEPWSVERAAVGDSITERYAVMVAVGARLGIRQAGRSAWPRKTWTSSGESCTSGDRSKSSRAGGRSSRHSDQPQRVEPVRVEARSLACRCSGNSGERLPRAPASLRERAPGARCGHPGAGRVPRAR